MEGVIQRLRGLKTDSVSRHEPQDRRIALFDPRVVRGQDSLATTGRRPQANIWDLRQVLQRGSVASAVTSEAVCVLGFAGDSLIGVLRPCYAGLLEETLQYGQSIGLVLFELHGSVPCLYFVWGVLEEDAFARKCRCCQARLLAVHRQRAFESCILLGDCRTDRLQRGAG